jgi:hypothetical protein
MKSEGSNDIEKVLIENSTASAIFHFSDIFSFSNRNESSDESWEASCMRVFSTLMSHTPVKRREQELHGVVMRVERREFVWKFSQLSCPGQTRTRVAWELVIYELRSENLHAESILNTHAPVKRKQELHESWEARVCMRVSVNSHAPVKREQELHESWWQLTGYYRARGENSHGNSH